MEMHTAGRHAVSVRVDARVSGAQQASGGPPREAHAPTPTSARLESLQRLKESVNASPRARALVQMRAMLGASARQRIPQTSVDRPVERGAQAVADQAGQLPGDEQSTEYAEEKSRPSVDRSGNSAVVQRRVGFEFEDNRWSAWEKTSLGTAMPPVARPVRRKAALHRGTNFALEGDDTPGPDRSNLEFVTDPFDTTPAGINDLMTSLGEIGQIVMANLAPCAGQPGPSAHAAEVGPGNTVLYEPGRYAEQPAHQLGGGDVAAPDILLSGGTTTGSFKMQATMGMSLESLPTVMRYFGRPQHESRGQTARRTGARKLMRGKAFDTSSKVADVVGSSPELAGQVLAQLGADPAIAAPDRAILTANAASLTGLLSAMMMYMKMLQLPLDGVLKYRIPFLGRSDFGSMFRALPVAQQGVLRAHAGRLAAHMVAVSNARPLLGRFNGKDSDQNLTVNSAMVNSPRQTAATPPAVTAMASLHISDWIDGITRGIDWLTPTNVLIWMSAMSTAGVAPTTPAERQEAANMLESFASIGAMDVSGGASLAVMENRGIAPEGPRMQGNDLNFFQVASMARDYLQFFVNLSARPFHPGAFPETPG